MDLREIIHMAAREEGLDGVGIAQVEGFSASNDVQFYSQWLDRGLAGEMSYLQGEKAVKRAAPDRVLPGAQSVICAALIYNSAEPRSTECRDSFRGWISRYAWGTKDYHDALMPRLLQVEAAIKSAATAHGLEVQARSYVDTGPIVERVYAKYAGVGWIGKNTCMINQQIGSWLFLGVILTSLELAADLPATDRCGSCTRCIDACPTEAIVSPGKLDARRCIAYLTIEKRGEIPEDLRAGVGHHVFGCDICQDVCPWNNKTGNAPATFLPEFQAQEKVFHPELKSLAQMDEAGFREVFRGSPVKRAKYAGLRRNVAVAMGNSGDKQFIPELERMAAGADPVVAEHARWAIKKLSS